MHSGVLKQFMVTADGFVSLSLALDDLPSPPSIPNSAWGFSRDVSYVLTIKSPLSSVSRVGAQ